MKIEFENSVRLNFLCCLPDLVIAWIMTVFEQRLSFLMFHFMKNNHKIIVKYLHYCEIIVNSWVKARDNLKI